MFLLRKWYLDVTAPDGSVAVAYWAEVRWGRWVRHGSALFRYPARGAAWRFGVPTGAGPAEGETPLTWNATELGCRIRLTPLLPPSEHRLLDTPPAAVTWRAVAPMAEAEFRFNDGSHLAGPGYAEWVELRIPPWQLPIEALRWGRFLSPSTSLVWIDWQGEHPLRLILRNGVSVPPGTIADDMVRMGGGVLSLSDRLPLAHADVSVMLAPSVLRPVLARLSGVWQTRWLSRGLFTGTDGTAVAGTAIHEVVRRGGTGE
ncbi:MAG: hypothetical protein OEW17_09160 [Gemmatimonadota bacterium]|nr:hypothetical protein [Gemmatimonadota bacterium]MDH4348962.1 hypothetical protein [Gemmatimonadota bacterium]MDH5284933.1 hypothetical protein [Gemmatimonadota bacterium]